MSENKREIEAQGQDVESAIESGLAALGVSRSDVVIEVIDEGSRGLLGIGSREAVVRLTASKMEPVEKADVDVVEVEEPDTETAVTGEPLETVTDDAISEEDEGEVAVSVMQELLHKLQVSATVTAHLSEPDDLTGRQIHVLEINGDDLGMLIGPRGETLNAIQHISRLMVGHQLRQRVGFVIDVEGYRQRRQQALARLAERMAQKVSTRKRAISLEPMPPHERRIIHITLRESEEVYTQSTGEGNRRKVRILPK